MREIELVMGLKNSLVIKNSVRDRVSDELMG